MEIQKAKFSDLSRIMEIYSHARAFMAEHGNPNQWGPENWPPQSLIEQDIARGKSFLCTDGERILGVFFYDFGERIDPRYNIDECSWQGEERYGVIHRLASDGTVRGTGSFCLNWAFEQCHNLRLDTHTDNIVMQNMLKKNGFVQCGTFHVNGNDQSWLAYEKM